MGLDFTSFIPASVWLPAYGDEELRRVAAERSTIFTPTSTASMRPHDAGRGDPHAHAQEAIEELEHAVKVLGMKACCWRLCAPAIAAVARTA